MLSEAKTFENEFLGIMKSNMRDFEGRITRSAVVEKVIEKKKEKKKVQEGQKKITVIARNGTNFVKKDVVYKEEEGKPAANGKA